MEIAKIDNILQGKLLLEESSHKLCDMVGLDKLKQEYESSDDKKKIQLSHIKHDKSCKVEREEVHSSSNSSSNNNNSSHNSNNSIILKHSRFHTVVIIKAIYKGRR